MNEWLTNIYKAFIYVSAILFIIALNTTGDTTINASISGYATMIVSILLILTIILNGFTQTTKTASTFQIISNLFITIGPFFRGPCIELLWNFFFSLLDSNFSSNVFTL